jgi:hypothetical protein
MAPGSPANILVVRSAEDDRVGKDSQSLLVGGGEAGSMRRRMDATTSSR